MEKRTKVSFPITTDFWEIVGDWAMQNGYSLVVNDVNFRKYKKGTGMLVAPTMMTVEKSGENVTFEVWINVGTFARICSLFLMPKEMGIRSGGIKGVVPRNMARDAVNKLLIRLGGPVIP